MAKRPEKIILVYTTTATRNEAERIVQDLLEERLVACANLWPISSRYWWQKRIEKAREHGLLLKTRKSLYPKVEKRIRALHSYTLPAVEAWELSRISRPFQDWVAKETKDYER